MPTDKRHPAVENPATFPDAMCTAAEEAYEQWKRDPSFVAKYGAAGPSSKDSFLDGYLASCEEWF